MPHLEIKGFITTGEAINNSPQVIAPIGELSTFGYSFARDVGVYKLANTNAALLSFVNKLDGDSVKLSFEQLDPIAKVVEYMQTANSVGNMPNTIDALRIELTNQLYGIAKDFDVGNILTENSIIMPEWVSWTNDNGDLYKVWFADDAFVDQYPCVETYVVPPIDNLNDFFQSYTQVKNMMALETNQTMFERIQKFKGAHPESLIEYLEFNYHDPAKVSPNILTNWVVLVHGNSGVNIDTIIDAIQDYILSNSSHVRSEWVEIFPDIFRRTEFRMVPMWENIAIPNLKTRTGIYSPIVEPAKESAYLQSVYNSFTPEFIAANQEVFTHTFKSAGVVSLPSSDNLAGKTKLTMIYPDYIAVNPLHEDFNNMSVKTQSWANTLNKLVVWAEKATSNSSFEKGISRVQRDGKWYMGAKIDNIGFLVLCRKENA